MKVLGKILFWMLALVLMIAGLFLNVGNARGQSTKEVIYTIISTIQGGVKFNVNFFEGLEANLNGSPGTNYGPFLSATDGTNELPVEILVSSSAEIIGDIPLIEPAEVLTDSITLNFSNYFMVVPIVTAPIFLNNLTTQSVFVGSNVVLPSPAVHTSGYQWQCNGTNLVESPHYIGVTNGTLAIANVQLADAGAYSVVAANPLNPATNSATLYVYKPVRLSLARASHANGPLLVISNQDGSTFEPERVSHLQIYSTTNLSEDLSTWNLETNTGGITNGMLEIPFAPDGSAAKFWQLTEQ